MAKNQKAKQVQKKNNKVENLPVSKPVMSKTSSVIEPVIPETQIDPTEVKATDMTNINEPVDPAQASPLPSPVDEVIIPSSKQPKERMRVTPDGRAVNVNDPVEYPKNEPLLDIPSEALSLSQFRSRIMHYSPLEVVEQYKLLYKKDRLQNPRACYDELIRLGYSKELRAGGVILANKKDEEE